MNRAARRSRTVRANVFSSSSSSDSRPTSGADSPQTGAPSSTAQSTRWAATGSRQPRSSSGPTGSSSTRSRIRRAAAGPMRISFGPASCWSRAARLTGSPVAKVDSTSSATTSPDSIPTRASRPSSLHAVERRERRAHGALRVVLVRERHAECGHDGVAGELLHRAAVRDDAVRDLVEEARDLAPDDLRVHVCDELGGRDEVDEQHRGELAFHRCMLVAPAAATGPFP